MWQIVESVKSFRNLKLETKAEKVCGGPQYRFVNLRKLSPAMGMQIREVNSDMRARPVGPSRFRHCFGKKRGVSPENGCFLKLSRKVGRSAFANRISRYWSSITISNLTIQRDSRHEYTTNVPFRGHRLVSWFIGMGLWGKLLSYSCLPDSNSNSGSPPLCRTIACTTCETRVAQCR